MKGGFNKILRNIVAGSADTEYEKVSFSASEKGLFPAQVYNLFLLCCAAFDEGNFPHGLEGTQGEARHL